MTDLDQAIRRTLSAEDQAFLDKLDRESPIDEVMKTFTGRWAVLNVAAAVVTFVMFAGFVLSVWNLAHATDVREAVLWSTGAVLLGRMVAMLKIWFWMEMHRNQVLREVKRLELQIARLRQG